MFFGIPSALKPQFVESGHLRLTLNALSFLFLFWKLADKLIYSGWHGERLTDRFFGLKTFQLKRWNISIRSVIRRAPIRDEWQRNYYKAQNIRSKKNAQVFFILRKNYNMYLFMTLAASLIPYWGIWRLEINKLNQREDKFRRNSICNHKNIFCYHRKSFPTPGISITINFLHAPPLISHITDIAVEL